MKFAATRSGLRLNAGRSIGLVVTHMFSAKVAAKSTGASASGRPSSQ
jgi:hypothetical protein